MFLATSISSFSSIRTLRSTSTSVETEEVLVEFRRNYTKNDSVINEADEEEKKWWTDLTYKNIDEKR
jgi:hypothetical protein